MRPEMTFSKVCLFLSAVFYVFSEVLDDNSLIFASGIVLVIGLCGQGLVLSSPNEEGAD